MISRRYLKKRGSAYSHRIRRHGVDVVVNNADMGVSLVTDYTDIVPTSDWMLYLYPLYLLCVSLPGDRVEGMVLYKFTRQPENSPLDADSSHKEYIWGSSSYSLHKQQNKNYICATN